MSLYLEASSILLETSGSLKSRIYHRPSSSPTLKSPPARLYALIIETLKHQSLLNEVIENSGILGFERKLTHSLALLLLHDHLLTRNGISTSTGPLKTAILNHKARLQAEFTRARLRRGYGSTADLLAAIKKESEAKIPRWVRVNTLRSSLSAVLATLADYSPVESIAELSGKVYYKDPIVENLLAFPPATDFTTHPLYLSGAFILQDRSSCLPAHLLAPPPGAWVVDATAAPGNKTTHLAALLQGGGGGNVIAFEKDLRRAEVLKKMVHSAGGEELITIRAGSDFLKADPKEEPLRFVSHLLLDPSCSGSGIISRSEYSLIPLSTSATAPTGKKRKRGGSKPAAPAKSVVIINDPEDDEQEETKSLTETATSRLHFLSSFQKSMILYAMTFPSAQKISYSTCSIHAEENEHVVTSVLASKVARRRGWRVEKRADGNLREWERRGILESCGGDKDVAEACVRCNPIEDGGIGFFVVAFVRDGSIDDVDEENETSPEQQQQQQQQEEEEEEEWNGFSDDDEKKITIEPMANIETNPKRQKQKQK